MAVDGPNSDSMPPAADVAMQSADAVPPAADGAAQPPDAAPQQPDVAPSVADAAPQQPDVAPSVADAPPAPDAAPPARDAAPPAPDAAPPAPDAAPPPRILPITLNLADAERLGPLDAFFDAPNTALGLHRQATLRFAFEPLPAPMVLWVRARVWRVEDGVMTFDGRPALLPGDARAPWARIIRPFTEAKDSPLLVEAGATSLELQAALGTLEVYGAELRDPRDDAPAPVAEVPLPLPHTVVLPSCGLDCDDGAALQAVLLAAPVGPVEVQLIDALYVLRTPVVITRHDVTLRGLSLPTVIEWAPINAGQSAAITFRGSRGGLEVPLESDHVAGQTRLAVPVLAFGGVVPDAVELTADDFGDVPVPCLEGRDVERFSRHLLHQARVVSVSPAGLLLDRPLALDVPLGSRPRVRALHSLRGARVIGLDLRAACPEARDEVPFAPARCEVPEVGDDDGLVFERTVGARVSDVSARFFGRYSIYVESSLDTVIDDYDMAFPSNYGEGGRGYGVHLIHASRSVVSSAAIGPSRHAVVVDFGSSDSQILDSTFVQTTLAAVDVHGEASRDTLVRGNDIDGGTSGVLIGGGGTEAHCNDGPRHWVHRNRFGPACFSGVSVSNATRHVSVIDNHFDGALVSLTLMLGAGDVEVRHNHFRDSVGQPLFVGAGSGPLFVLDNRFDEVCAAEGVAVVEAGGDLQLGDNLFCGP